MKSILRKILHHFIGATQVGAAPVSGLGANGAGRVVDSKCCSSWAIPFFKVMIGREPGTPFVKPLETSEDKSKVEKLDPTRMQAEPCELVRTQEQYHQEVVK